MSRRLDARHAAVAKISQPRAEPKTQHPAQGEDVIGRVASIGEVHVDLEAAAVVKQAVENKRRFVRRRRDDSRMELPCWSETWV